MRQYLILILLLIVPICCYSQNTSKITITSEQLKTTNLIFAEHQKLLQTLPLLKKENTNLKKINTSWERTDSIRRVQIQYCKNVLRDQNNSIENLNKSLKRQKNIVKYGSGCSIVLILLCLILK